RRRPRPRLPAPAPHPAHVAGFAAAGEDDDGDAVRRRDLAAAGGTGGDRGRGPAGTRAVGRAGAGEHGRGAAVRGNRALDRHPGRRQRRAGAAQRAVSADGVPVRALVTAVDAARLAGEAGTGLAGLPPGPACAEGGGARRWRPDLGARRGPGAGDGGVLRPGPATPARRRMTGGIQPEDRMTTTGPGSGPEPLPASAAARAPGRAAGLRAALVRLLRHALSPRPGSIAAADQRMGRSPCQAMVHVVWSAWLFVTPAFAGGLA